jgi:hypothetical protein
MKTTTLGLVAFVATLAGTTNASADLSAIQPSHRGARVVTLASNSFNSSVDHLIVASAACQEVNWYWKYSDCVSAGQASGRNWGCIQSALTGVYVLYLC